jgi:hypothetical protein
LRATSVRSWHKIRFLCWQIKNWHVSKKQKIQMLLKHRIFLRQLPIYLLKKKKKKPSIHRIPPPQIWTLPLRHYHHRSTTQAGDSNYIYLSFAVQGCELCGLRAFIVVSLKGSCSLKFRKNFKKVIKNHPTAASLQFSIP